jgi:hypothetical protein
MFSKFEEAMDFLQAKGFLCELVEGVDCLSLQIYGYPAIRVSLFPDYKGQIVYSHDFGGLYSTLGRGFSEHEQGGMAAVKHWLKWSS